LTLRNEDYDVEEGELGLDDANDFDEETERAIQYLAHRSTLIDTEIADEPHSGKPMQGYSGVVSSE
jgi:hypothetical protein